LKYFKSNRFSIFKTQNRFQKIKEKENRRKKLKRRRQQLTWATPGNQPAQIPDQPNPEHPSSLSPPSRSHPSEPSSSSRNLLSLSDSETPTGDYSPLYSLSKWPSRPLL
jgi:hypothetical protein